jgi:hypothetical protein
MFLNEGFDSCDNEILEHRRECERAEEQKHKSASMEMLLTKDEMNEAINAPYGKNMYELPTKSDWSIAKAQIAKCQKSEDAIRAEYEAKIKTLEKQAIQKLLEI